MILKRLLTQREMILAGALLLSIAIGVTVRQYREKHATPKLENETVEGESDLQYAP